MKNLLLWLTLVSVMVLSWCGAKPKPSVEVNHDDAKVIVSSGSVQNAPERWWFVPR